MKRIFFLFALNYILHYSETNQEIQYYYYIKASKSQDAMKAYKEDSLLWITTKLLITAKFKGKKTQGAILWI